MAHGAHQRTAWLLYLRSVLAGACFSALAIGVFIALFKMAREWEGDHTHTT